MYFPGGKHWCMTILHWHCFNTCLNTNSSHFLNHSKQFCSIIQIKLQAHASIFFQGNYPSCHRVKGSVHARQAKTERQTRLQPIWNPQLSQPHAWLWTVWGSRNSQREHANSTHKGPSWAKDWKPGSCCCDARCIWKVKMISKTVSQVWL